MFKAFQLFVFLTSKYDLSLSIIQGKDTDSSVLHKAIFNTYMTIRYTSYFYFVPEQKMWPYKANSSSINDYREASLLIDGDINTFHATAMYMPYDAWTRVYFMNKVS